MKFTYPAKAESVECKGRKKKGVKRMKVERVPCQETHNVKVFAAGDRGKEIR